MLYKLLIIAASGLSLISAQGTFKFKDTYPEPFKVPTPKPEWLNLIKNATITKAPVLKVVNGSPAPPEGVTGDPYCTWTFTGCLGPDDVFECPKGKWSVTYDDGPSAFSPKLYDYLDTTKQKVSFFLVGGQVKQFPEYAKRAFDAGHEIAMHTWSHTFMTTLTNEEIVAELKWTEQIIKEVTGFSPRYFRPPFGNIDDRVRDIAKALGFIPVIWSHDTNDWYMTEKSGSFKKTWISGNVTQWAKEAGASATGGVSLQHDLYAETVDVAIEIFPILQKAYELSTIGQCENQPSYKEGKTVPSSAAANASASAASASAAEASKALAASKAAQEDDEGAGIRITATAAGLLITAIAAFFNAN